jgi:hypothetical protein
VAFVIRMVDASCTASPSENLNADKWWTKMRRSLIGALASGLLTICMSAQRYYPVGALSSDTKMDTIRSDWYSQELRFLHEPSLWRESRRPKKTVYRFLWLRAFHPPICVCLAIHSDSASITFKEGAFHGAGEPGRLLRTRTTRVSREQVNAFLKRVAEVHFWSIPSPNRDLGGPDGSEWILEGANRGAYKVVTAYTAPNNNPVRVLGLMLLFDLAHVRIPSNSIY